MSRGRLKVSGARYDNILLEAFHFALCSKTVYNTAIIITDTLKIILNLYFLSAVKTIVKIKSQTITDRL